MRYFVLIGMIMLLIGGCAFVQGEPAEPTATPIPVVKIDSDEMFDELTRTNTSSNIVKWEVDFKDKYVDLSDLGNFEITEITSSHVYLFGEVDKNIRLIDTDFRNYSRRVLFSDTAEVSDLWRYYVSCGFSDSQKPTIANFAVGDTFILSGIIKETPNRQQSETNFRAYKVEDKTVPSRYSDSYIREQQIKLPDKASRFTRSITFREGFTTFTDTTDMELEDCEFTSAPE